MNRRVLFLVCSDLQRGIEDARKRGTQIAARRFALPNNDDLRVIKNFNELDHVAGRTFLVKGSDYDTLPEFVAYRRVGGESVAGKDDLAEAAWLQNRIDFDDFVASGHGEWVSL